MTRFQNTVHWTLALCVFGYIGISILIIGASGPILAQVPLFARQRNKTPGRLVCDESSTP